MVVNPLNLAFSPAATFSTFGVPACIFDLAFEILALLPGDGLIAITAAIDKGMAAAYQMVGTIQAELLGMIGLKDTDGDGQYSWEVDSGLGGLGAFFTDLINGVATMIGFVQGIQQIIEQLQASVDSVVACFESLKSGYEASVTTDPIPEAQLEVVSFQAEATLTQTREFIDNCNRVLTDIGTILVARREGTLADPDVDQEEDDQIFRLTYGPPETKNGSFLLSVDGLYYNSQSRLYASGSEVPTLADISALSFVPNTEKWNLDHSPNLGGKGTQITLKDLDDYIGTLFDTNTLDESDYLKSHYEADHTIAVLEGNKTKTATDMERHKQDLITSGYATNSAVIQNLQQDIFATVDSFENKIAKRKKQIEVAVKAYDLFGYNEIFEKGKIPVNDFSYLSNLNLAVGFKKQKELVLDQGEVSGVVLPIKPTFVKQATGAKTISLTPLNIGPVGTGAFADTPPTSSTLAPALTLSDPIVMEGLLSVYSFLDAKVEGPSSTKTNVISCNDERDRDAQLVGRSAEDVFCKGLGIPLLEGIVSFRSDNNSIHRPQDVGSYLRLPAIGAFQDLMFNLSGCSFDFWLHLPGGFSGSNLLEQGTTGYTQPVTNADLPLDKKGAWTDYNYYKLILANENIGGSYAGNPDIMPRNFNTDTVRGMVMGFTRDPQMARRGTTAPRGTDTDIAINYNDITTAETIEDYAFFIAPTQSIKETVTEGNTTTEYRSCEFVRKGSCESTLTEFDGMVIPHSQQTKSGFTIKDVSSSFVHMNVSFDVSADQVTVSLNGEELETSAMSEVFGIETKKPARIPSFIKQGDDPSFEYEAGQIDNSFAATIFNEGPLNDTYFTPWIIGGGWTDGLPVDEDASVGGFMGNSHGFSSGLGGHVGSFKIYNKPLNTTEVTKNYDAHKAFFTNIKI